MKTVREIEFNSKTVLVRVDYNLPMDENGNIADDNRIRATLPLVNYLVDKGAKIVLASHMGRPKGKPAASLSLAPAAKRLSELLGFEVVFVDDCIGPKVKERVDQLEPGQIILLENLRFYKGEEENDPEFARSLAELCQVYVNDAFAVSHRTAASIVAITRFVREACAGFLLEKEVKCFHDSIENPVHPLVAIIGGAKVSSKLGALENMLNHVDALVIGGAMANTFLKSQGNDVGASMVEEDLVETAAHIVQEARDRKINLILPVDLVVADRFDADAQTRVVDVKAVPQGWMALDIGPETGAIFARAIQRAATIVWNGPMGVFEMKPFCNGTKMVAAAVAAADAFSVVGGGDTGLAVNLCGVADKMSYVSTGGGAFLHLMEGKKLPGVTALD
ncbi:Pgk [Desulforapulum autotrophicum HRM2]|uniref:Phosphoglycerate kinase n=1 Tax=Desulforapulum autotrophicum (strain ATCC 43914 / DSM 3382 / VKM B-1955 / HRM2) TaxID=177437 RepID=PGK_DESAH|nr:phosphoglycerate kinase [Desulforapulum autotrophicum]C0Q9Z7.1 RecName: Full=Phosphoglycerate kinase [Desulforapulum autotrophicum HRM2]ACN16715.1 Pgk [Desulforapulum autotrophicum HRM2]